jgi:hypothetical protein
MGERNAESILDRHLSSEFVVASAQILDERLPGRVARSAGRDPRSSHHATPVLTRSTSTRAERLMASRTNPGLAGDALPEPEEFSAVLAGHEGLNDSPHPEHDQPDAGEHG